jgi:hypothetical protein
VSTGKPTREELDEDMHEKIEAAIDAYRADGNALVLCDVIDRAICNRNTRFNKLGYTVNLT